MVIFSDETITWRLCKIITQLEMARFYNHPDLERAAIDDLDIIRTISPDLIVKLGIKLDLGSQI